MDIWIDVDEKLHVDMETLKMAASYNWVQGPATVWVHSKHVGLIGQWIYTWRPVMDNQQATELALYVEDDVDISPYGYRFLRNLRAFYSDNPNVSCYSLQDASLVLDRAVKPRADPVYMHVNPGTWGMAPHPESWSEFQDWFHKQSQVPGFHPYVNKDVLHTKQYKQLEKKGRENTIWSMWFAYFMEKRKLQCVFSNLPTFIGKSGSSLSFNRHERGLHFNGKSKGNLIPKLLTHWHQEFINFPKIPKIVDYDGKVFNATG